MANCTTQDQIIAKAEALTEKNGKTPTYKELMAELGGGSPSTISRYYRDWRQKKDAELANSTLNASPTVENMPIPETISASLTAAWSSAVAEIKSQARKEIEAIQTMIQVDRAKLTYDIKERDDMICMLESESCELKQTFEDMKARIDELNAELVSKGNEIATQTGRIHELEKQLSKATEAVQIEHRRVEDIHMQVGRLEAQLKMA